MRCWALNLELGFRIQYAVADADGHDHADAGANDHVDADAGADDHIDADAHH